MTRCRSRYFAVKLAMPRPLLKNADAYCRDLVGIVPLDKIHVRILVLRVRAEPDHSRAEELELGLLLGLAELQGMTEVNATKHLPRLRRPWRNCHAQRDGQRDKRARYPSSKVTDW